MGTDRRYVTTRSDVHAFEDVSLDRNVTFFGLNLTAHTQTYYFTVRAFSAAGSYVDGSSDGVAVGFSGQVIPGRVTVSSYQSSVDTVRFSWEGFDSDMTITHYYAGISSGRPSLGGSSQDFAELRPAVSDQMDIYPLTVLETEAVAVVEGLTLKHGDVFYVTVVAVDMMGHCATAISGPVVVDTTPPERRTVTVNGFDAGGILFVNDPHILQVNLSNFRDPESGIHAVSIDLVSSTACSFHQGLPVIASIETINQSDVFLRELNLQERLVYFCTVTATNGAGLDTQSQSLPIMLDMSPPAPGSVKVGSSWTADEEVYHHSTDTVDSTIALRGPDSSQDCVTQLDLLAEDKRREWRENDGEFSADCVGFDERGLHLFVRHNAHLTGVNSGAAHVDARSWREGDYLFRLTPAVADHVVTGLSLASPTLQPPFRQQNQLTHGNQSPLPCDPSVNLCLDSRNHSTPETSMPPDSEYGVGLTFRKAGGEVKLVFWAQDATQLKRGIVPTDFDPTSTTADYDLRLRKQASTGSELWEVEVLVNNRSLTSVSGLVLHGHFVLSVYSWNVDNFFPPVVDVFSPFRLHTVLHSVSLPLARRPLCSYGAAFSDTVSGVGEVWMGLSDSLNSTANIAPYKLMYKFCLPCLLGCDAVCSSCQDTALTQDFAVFSLSLRGLDLQAADQVLKDSSARLNVSEDNSTASNTTADELNRYMLPTYYIDVRVFDHSGLRTDVKSLGVVVDKSPPVISSFHCYDPSFSEDADVVFLGNNHTVGATWDASEDVSGIRNVWVSLGTAPGKDDVCEQVLTNTTSNQHTFSGLALEEGGLYYITVDVTNEAGLSSREWRNFTVHTLPPDMSAVKLVPANVSRQVVGGVEVGLVADSHRLQLNLDVDPALKSSLDVEYYGEVASCPFVCDCSPTLLTVWVA